MASIEVLLQAESVPPRLFVHVANASGMAKLMGSTYSAEVVIGDTLLASPRIRPTVSPHLTAVWQCCKILCLLQHHAYLMMLMCCQDDGTCNIDTLFEANVPDDFCVDVLRFHEVKVNIFLHDSPHSHTNRKRQKEAKYQTDSIQDTGTRVKFGSVALPFTSQVIYPVNEEVGDDERTLLFRRPIELASRVYAPWARIVWGIPPRVDRTPPAMFFKDGSPHWDNPEPRKLKITHQMDFVNLKLFCQRYGHELGECQGNLTRCPGRGTLYNFPDFQGIPTLIRGRMGEDTEFWIPIEGSSSHELKLRIRTDWFSSNEELNEALGVVDHMRNKPKGQNKRTKAAVLDEEAYRREMAAIKVQRTFRRTRSAKMKPAVLTVKEDTGLMVRQ